MSNETLQYEVVIFDQMSTEPREVNHSQYHDTFREARKWAESNTRDGQSAQIKARCFEDEDDMIWEKEIAVFIRVIGSGVFKRFL